MQLNLRAQSIVERMLADPEALRISTARCKSGATLIDCGIQTTGGLQAGLLLAKICLAGLGSVELTPDSNSAGWNVAVVTDHPVRACLAAQYAGWKIGGEGYFAMGSGPMRAAADREAMIKSLAFGEKVEVAVGVLETRKLPPPEVCADLASECGVPAEKLTVLAAPTASLAGGVQIVARSVETALHKLHELEFDLAAVVSGAGSAPLPPVAKNDIAAIGRTNDAILYGSQVTFWVRCDDSAIKEIGPRVPSSGSSDYGQPFAEIFAKYDHDFYKIDPHLFSPAVVVFNNLQTGRVFRFGQLAPDVLQRSFYPGMA